MWHNEAILFTFLICRLNEMYESTSICNPRSPAPTLLCTQCVHLHEGNVYYLWILCMLPTCPQFRRQVRGQRCCHHHQGSQSLLVLQAVLHHLGCGTLNTHSERNGCVLTQYWRRRECLFISRYRTATLTLSVLVNPIRREMAALKRKSSVKWDVTWNNRKIKNKKHNKNTQFKRKENLFVEVLMLGIKLFSDRWTVSSLCPSNKGFKCLGK